MADLVDPVNASAIATSFGQTMAIAAQGHGFVTEKMRHNALQADKEISTREAQAMQEVRTSAQAREILQARSAADQPQVAAK
jgi:hypothetical protein